jgi:hypothetical protein
LAVANFGQEAGDAGGQCFGKQDGTNDLGHVDERTRLSESGGGCCCKTEVLTCHGIFPPSSIRVWPNLRTDNEANEIHGRADHRHPGRA